MSSLAAGTARSVWRLPLVAALAVAVGGAATIVGAWYFQYGLGLAPCPLCLQQRWPYYVAVSLAAIAALGALRGGPRPLLAGGLALAAVAMLVGAGLGAYHAGVEWQWWAGPQDCAAAATMAPAAPGTSLLDQMRSARVVRCDEAPWRDPVLALSLAGWNVLISLALAGIALAGALAVVLAPVRGR